MLWLGTCLRLVCISTCSTVMSWSMWSITGRRCCRYQVEHDKLKSICTKRLACWALTLVASLLFYYDHKVHAHAIYALVLSKDGGRSSRCTIWWQWCFGWRWTVGKGVFGGGRRRLTVVGLRQSLCGEPHVGTTECCAVPVHQYQLQIHYHHQCPTRRTLLVQTLLKL